MSQIEWYYAKDDQPCGPVSPVEHRQFAEQGELREETLVWREGMSEWIPAGRVKGLFGNRAEVAGRNQTPASGEAVAQAAPKLATELPVRRAPPVFEPMGGSAHAPTPRRPSADTMLEDVEPAPIRHPLDVLSSMAREQFDAHFVYSTTVLFRIGGQVGSFLGVVSLIALALAFGSKTGQLAVAVPLAALGAAALLISQFGALRLYPALEQLDRTAWARISTTAPLDSLAWTFTTLGLAALLGLAGFALASGAAWPATLAVFGFVFCQYAAVVAWDAKGLRLEVGLPTSPGEEAAAILSFLGKLAWRLSAVAHGAAIVLGSLATLNAAVHLGLADEPDPAWFGWETAVPLGLLLLAIPLPVAGYLTFLGFHLAAELCQRWLGYRR
jgi:hypothetical protein